MIRSRPTLGGLLVRRIAVFTVVAMALQLAVVCSDYYWNVGELSRLFVEQETERLMEGLNTAATPDFTLPEAMHSRYAGATTGYIARIRTPAGQILFESCDDACESRFLPVDLNPPDFWLRSLKPGKPLFLTGGRAFFVGDQRYLVEVATLGDPENVVNSVFWNEVLEHLVQPMSLLLVLVVGAMLIAMRVALKPVRLAAEAAERIDPLDSRSHLQVQDMPREIAHLTEAINRAFERVGELMKSQKLLTTGIAHEVRTPLAAIKLELGRIDHPRARKAEADLDELAHFVSQLTALARLDSFDHAMFEAVDLAALAADVVGQLAPLVYENRHTLELEAEEAVPFSGVPALIKDALRNLIENALRHTPDGTSIIVRVRPGRLEVEDRVMSAHPEATFANSDYDHRIMGEGAGWDHAAFSVKPGNGLGIGLKIVERIASLHGGKALCQPTAGGHIFSLAFEATETASSVICKRIPEGVISRLEDADASSP
ncbi:ATP-binding protein [Rhizobium paknamense]|uniref:histidine kinase n=1 Tax=Rhizobium paknamense TaxID=1206817 RepID=A0ABU0IG63_9HYPH|nr:HAMP domain-containing sensor histidine kinase [Rhizobium paknamense]MDQ0457136.1 signal transduction histidine kinase [Rhizobium paknamense]